MASLLGYGVIIDTLQNLLLSLRIILNVFMFRVLGMVLCLVSQWLELRANTGWVLWNKISSH